MEKVDAFHATVSACLAILTALWGWTGWVAVAWIVAMALDYITGSVAALHAGEWTSKQARDGIYHKIGAVAAVLVAGLMDLTIAHLIKRFPDVLPLPITYTSLLCPLVMVWYILTEAGSILENAGKLGAEYPEWLTNAIKALRSTTDKAGENTIPKKEE